MATYLLLPGAGGDGWYWHLVAERLASAGHRAVPVDFPAADESAGLAEYTEAALAALGPPGEELIVVAQSLGGCTGPLVAARVPTRLLVLVNAMTPTPGEAPGDWWANTGHGAAIQDQREHSWSWADFDLHRVFLHDLPADLVAELLAREESPQSDGPFGAPWPLAALPDVPIRFLQGRDDRFFPVEFQRRVVRERLGLAIDEMPGGHLVALSRPDEVAARLESYRAGVGL